MKKNTYSYRQKIELIKLFVYLIVALSRLGFLIYQLLSRGFLKGKKCAMSKTPITFKGTKFGFVGSASYVFIIIIESHKIRLINQSLLVVLQDPNKKHCQKA